MGTLSRIVVNNVFVWGRFMLKHLGGERRVISVTYCEMDRRSKVSKYVKMLINEST